MAKPDITLEQIVGYEAPEPPAMSGPGIYVTQYGEIEIGKGVEITPDVEAEIDRCMSWLAGLAEDRPDEAH